MTKARDIADFKFEDIVDTGTEGTRVATGTTAQRGSTAGQLRFNSETNVAEYYTGTEFKVIETPPTLTSINTSLIDSNSGSTTSIDITGSFFGIGASVLFIPSSGSNITPVSTTLNSSSSITVVVTDSDFVNANEPYSVKVTNPSGTNATLSNVLNVDTTVSWQTTSGLLGSIGSADTGNHFTVSATDADGDTITYSVQSGSLPNGLSLDTSTGVISGDPVDVLSDTTSNFTLRASTPDATADRSFSITITPPPVDIDYLLIAGGGGGAGAGQVWTASGGGGAGGYRTTYGTSGRNSSAETKPSCNVGTVLTMTVGGGGNGQPAFTNGQNGSDSSIAFSDGKSTITSLGGGGGSEYSRTTGQSGGSGGGVGQFNSGATGGSGTAGQGFDGGNASATSQDSSVSGAGGGGAGSNGSGVGSSSSGASGGSGLSSSITGNTVTRAGGGGGGGSGSGGSGGGGSGGNINGGNGSNGSSQTGSGGGGTRSDNNDGTAQRGGNGGSGIIILRLPTSRYSGTTTGSPTVSTDGTDTILTFTGDGSYTV